MSVSPPFERAFDSRFRPCDAADSHSHGVVCESCDVTAYFRHAPHGADVAVWTRKRGGVLGAEERVSSSRNVFVVRCMTAARDAFWVDPAAVRTLGTALDVAHADRRRPPCPVLSAYLPLSTQPSFTICARGRSTTRDD